MARENYNEGNVRSHSRSIVRPVFLIVLGVIASHQFLAHLLRLEGYVLMEPLRYAFIKIEHPLSIINLSLLDVPPKVFLFGFSPLFLIILLSIFVVARGKKSYRLQNLHGSASWATTKEIKRRGMIDKFGLVFGQLEGAKIGKKKVLAPLVTAEETTNFHALLVAPTRAGKGVGVIVPTLLNWYKSVFVLDLKGENYKITAGYRSQFSSVIRMALASKNSVKFNPLLEIRESNLYADSSEISSIIIGGGDQKEDHWVMNARALLTAIIMHVVSSLAIPLKHKNLYTCYKILTLSGQSLEKDEDEEEEYGRRRKSIFDLMIKEKHVNEGVHERIITILKGQKAKNGKELLSIISTAQKDLEIMNDENIMANMATSDFFISDFMNYEHPISLYFIVESPDLVRLAGIIRLIINFFLNKFTREEISHGNRVLKNDVLFMLDEFPQLGKFDRLHDSMSLVAGYGLNFFIVAQSFEQLARVYGRDHIFISQSRYMCTFAAADLTTAELVSKMLGDYSVFQNQGGISEQINKVRGGGSKSTSKSETKRALMLPQELLQMPGDMAILFEQGKKPIRMKKVLYYADSRFKPKLLNFEFRIKDELEENKKSNGWEKRAWSLTTPAYL